MSDNDNKSQEVPDKMNVAVYKGRVILQLYGTEQTIALDPAAAMQLANTIFTHATSIDASFVNEQLQNNEKMLSVYARMLFGAAGMWLTTKSAVGLADHNESVGLAVRILCQEAELSIIHGKAPKRGRGPQEGGEHDQPEAN